MVKIKGAVIDKQDVLLLVAEGSNTRREWQIPLIPEAVSTLKYLEKRMLKWQSTDDITHRQIFNVVMP